MSDLTVVSLFDGIGGFPLAFERVGATTVATVEIDPAAAAVSRRHFPHATQFGDVTKVTGNDLRATGFVPERGIITAGWPCQDFSVAGRRAGLDGARSGLWWEVVRILAECRPAWFLGENVPGLLSSVCDPECPGGCMASHGGAFGAVLGSLGQLGYGIAYRVLDAQHFGVPQRRQRVFIVGHLGTPWTAPAQVLLEPESGAGDSAEGSETGQEIAGTTASGAGIASFTAVQHGQYQSGIGTIRASGGDCGGGHAIGANSSGNGVCIAGVAENQQGEIRESPTVGALSNGGGKPGQGYQAVREGTTVRRLTELECERLQGYPDGWTDGQTGSARYRQLGNSVAVPVVEWIARRLVAIDGEVVA